MNKLLCITHKVLKESGLIHIAERAINAELPDWRKLPYCRNGGLNLQQWEFTEINPQCVYEADVCQSCLRRIKANRIEIHFAIRPQEHYHTCSTCQIDIRCPIIKCTERSFCMCDDCIEAQRLSFQSRVVDYV